MPDGVIEGGWGFVWAAYGITWAGLVLYAGSLYYRLYRAKLENDQEDQP